MSDLYDKNLFANLDSDPLTKEPKKPQYALHLIAAALILVGALLFIWSRFQKEAQQQINVNLASVTELQRLPGVGPVLAKEIVLSRPYNTPEQLMSVKGIGAKTYEKIAPRITVD